MLRGVSAETAPVPTSPRPRQVGDLPPGTVFSVVGKWPLYMTTPSCARNDGPAAVVVGDKGSNRGLDLGTYPCASVSVDTLVEETFGTLWLTRD